MNSPTVRRALVIGGGPGGLTAAIALRREGVEALVCERAREGSEAGSGLTLWPNAMKALGMIGLAERVREISLPSGGIAMRNWRGECLFDVEQGVELLESLFGVSGAAVHRGELLDVLHRALGQEALLRGMRCTGIRQDEEGVTALFEGGEEMRGDILIGADGIRSVVRAQLFGDAKPRYAGFTVWRGVADYVLESGVGLTTMGRGAQFGLFPMTRGRVYWFASVNAAEGERDWPGGRKSELLRRFGDWHRPIREVVEATDEGAILRNDIYDREPLKSWGAGRVTLLGDAAHPSTPNLGQGACQAIEDAVVLAECLRPAAGRDIRAALTTYEARRLGRANSMLLQSRRLGELGRWKNPVACWLRDKIIKGTPERVRLKQLKWMFDFEP
jgi:2-polyprenyl-6-methoxyphenol hydroxylase-like FAD-dependent oxidoreductase